MKADEVTQVVLEFSAIQPAYKRWRNEQALLAADDHGSQENAWNAMKASMTRTLEEVSLEDAIAVVRLMETGRLPIPPYGELSLTILREAKIAREPLNSHYEYNYLCDLCLDTGLINVWNPRFVEAYRPEFEKVSRVEAARYTNHGNRIEENGDPSNASIWEYTPANWEHQAARWWRDFTKGTGGPIHHVALCHCDCRRVRLMRSEREDSLSGNRRSSCGKQAGPPACGNADYLAKKMPRKTADPFSDLTDWYATHEVNEVYEWQP